MKRVLLPMSLGMAVFLFALWLTVSPAHAIKNFQDDFFSRYVDPSANDRQEAARKKVLLAEVVEGAKCNVCHDGRDKRRRNAYGDELARLLDKKADAENTERVISALEVVGRIKCDPTDENSLTYGDLIGLGKLPVQPVSRRR